MANNPRFGPNGDYGDEKQFQEDMKTLRKRLASEYQTPADRFNQEIELEKEVAARRDHEMKEEILEEFKEKEEAVDHPSHYNAGEFEVIDVIADAGLGEGFCLGNTLKYILRAKHKLNYVEDLQKAEWYLQWWINYIDGEKP